MYKYFVANEYVKDVFEIDLNNLKSMGKKVILTDLDNTLVASDVAEPTKEILEFLNTAKALGFEIYIVSNNNQGRVEKFAKNLGIEAHHSALKPLRAKSSKILKKYNPIEVVFIGDQMMTDILVANRLGVYSISVTPVNFSADETATKFNRKLEKLIIKGLKKRNLPVPLHARS